MQSEIHHDPMTGNSILKLYFDKRLNTPELLREIEGNVIDLLVKDFVERKSAEILASIDTATIANLVNVGIAQEIAKLAITKEESPETNDVKP